jgi:hypothetical protein
MARRDSPGSGQDTDVHQVLHGYDHGHRLVASSRDIHDDDLRLIDRLSDASGQRYVRDNDGYVTGYPLPSGELYALARTWYVLEASRPNIVWTHTLLVPPALLAAPRLDRLFMLFRRPGANDRDDWAPYRGPLSMPVVRHGWAMAPTIDPLARHVLAQLYQPGVETVTCPYDDADRRTALCLAIWNQQWPRLRRQFSFCSGALEPRRTAVRPFDLLLTPQHDGFPTPSPFPHDDLPAELVNALTADLAEPGPLRVFLWACGADSSRRRVMPLLVEAYVNATSGVPPATAIVRVTMQAPKATSMRRLKRALLHPQNGLLSGAPATEIMATLLTPQVADHVLASDAHLTAWASRAWQRDPRIVLAALPTSPKRRRTGESKLGSHDSRRPEVKLVNRTIADAAREELFAVVTELADPGHLAALAISEPHLAAELLSTQTNELWWAAWAMLPDDAFTAMLETAGPQNDSTVVLSSVRALTRVPLGPPRWRVLRDRVGSAAVAALLSVLPAPESDGGRWTEALWERPELLAAAIRAGLDPPQLAVACDGVSDLAFVRDIGYEPFAPLASAPQLWRQKPRRAGVLLAALLLDKTSASDRAAAALYNWLYERFSRDEAGDAWELLAPLLPRKHNDWDRCQILAGGVADLVRGKTSQPRPAILDNLPESYARSALEAELDRRSNQGNSASPGRSREATAWDEIIRSVWPW